MSDLAPSTESVATLVAQFERELAAAKSARDAQSVRDRYLGRKNSIVASWMQLIGSAAPAEKKNIGRYANELKQAIDARWTTYEEAARDAAPIAGAVDVTLPGRRPGSVTSTPPAGAVFRAASSYAVHRASMATLSALACWPISFF